MAVFSLITNCPTGNKNPEKEARHILQEIAKKSRLPKHPDTLEKGKAMAS
jgi:hypothetical protein